ncbi:MAG: glycosyltransferase family protein [Deltaproteobacteria bacterium]|nr:glycosyltransferase family protein [Deltaproteobacteria bacterium]
MKIGAIVQARMGSTRFPGKVLKPLAGVPLLWHTLHRLTQVREIDEVILATSALDRDDPLAGFARKERIPVFRGSEDDVLERYCLAAREYRLDGVVRITADCPLIDPDVTARTVRLFLETGADFASNTLKRTFPRGTDTEAFSADALERAHAGALRQEEREHVTLHMYTHPEMFVCRGLENDVDLSHIRHCVDYERDYLFVKALFHHLGGQNLFFSTKDVQRIVLEHPWLLEINAGLEQRIP